MILHKSGDLSYCSKLLKMLSGEKVLDTMSIISLLLINAKEKYEIFNAININTITI